MLRNVVWPCCSCYCPRWALKFFVSLLLIWFRFCSQYRLLEFVETMGPCLNWHRLRGFCLSCSSNCFISSCVFRAKFAFWELFNTLVLLGCPFGCKTYAQQSFVVIYFPNVERKMLDSWRFFKLHRQQHFMNTEIVWIFTRHFEGRAFVGRLIWTT